MTAAPIMIVPGNNRVLHYVGRQIAGLSDVRILSSANDALWLARTTAPRIVLADVQLNDMSGADLAEILRNFAPGARILICGQPDPATLVKIEAVGAEFVALDGSTGQNVEKLYRALDMEPPRIPTTSDLSAPPAATTVVNRAPVPQPAAPVLPSSPAPKPAITPDNQTPTAPAQVTNVASGGSGESGRMQPAPTGPDAAPFGGSGALVIQPQQYQTLSKLLNLLQKEVNAQCVLLIDPAGMVLVQAGQLNSTLLAVAGPLLATSFSTSTQLTRHLGEQHASAAYIHEGDRYDLYAFNVSSRVSLIVIFDKRINPGKLGTVWVYAKRTLRELQRILRLP